MVKSLNPGYALMLGALVSFSLLGTFAKIADAKHCRPKCIYLLLYFWAFLFVCCFVVIFEHAGLGVPSTVYWIAVPFGIAGGIGGLAFQIGIHYGKIINSWLIINLSAIVPAMASVLVYREPVSSGKVAALALVTLSIILLWKDKKAETERIPPYEDRQNGHLGD
jgi:drug/metabolite transporter (DMT)-like permease